MILVSVKLLIECLNVLVLPYLDFKRKLAQNSFMAKYFFAITITQVHSLARSRFYVADGAIGGDTLFSHP